MFFSLHTSHSLFVSEITRKYCMLVYYLIPNQLLPLCVCFEELKMLWPSDLARYTFVYPPNGVYVCYNAEKVTSCLYEKLILTSEL